MTDPLPETAPFPGTLAARVEARSTRLCVGVDPLFEGLPPPLAKLARDRGPAAALGRFACELIEATHDLAACVKLQVAHFERFGAEGYRALEEGARSARELGLPLVIDAKRADIGATAESYAAYFLGPEGLDADAITVQPYMGEDAVTPFLAHEGKGVFVLCRTSNPSAGEFQDLALADGRPLYRAVLDAARGWEPKPAGPWGRVGLVAGATAPGALGEIRRAAPRSWLLVPGVGAQGATAADVVGAFDARGLGAVVNASRSIGFAHLRDLERDWREAARRAAALLRDEIERALATRGGKNDESET